MSAWLIVLAVIAAFLIFKPKRRARDGHDALCAACAHRIERRIASLENALDERGNDMRRRRHG